MTITTKFNKEDVLFFLDPDTTKILSGVVDTISISSSKDYQTINYTLSIPKGERKDFKCISERCLFNSPDEIICCLKNNE